MQTTVLRMLALLRERELDSGEILERLRAVERDAPSLPSLYRSLKDAADAGWVRVTGTEAPPGRGRPRQLYTLTEEGRRVAEAEARRLRDLADAVLEGAMPGPEPR